MERPGGARQFRSHSRDHRHTRRRIVSKKTRHHRMTGVAATLESHFGDGSERELVLTADLCPTVPGYFEFKFNVSSASANLRSLTFQMDFDPEYRQAFAGGGFPFLLCLAEMNMQPSRFEIADR